MYKFIRYFNQNRKKIFRVIIFIAFILLVIQFFNYKAATDDVNTNPNTSNQTTNTNTPSNINTNSALSGNTGNTFSSQFKEQTDIITQFIENCNNANTEVAYNMLSQDCKENMYPTLESFIENYYKSNFQSNKIYNIQRWTGSMYKVELKENMLQTGKLSAENKQDFITIVYESDEEKLNINNYIGRTNFNKQTLSGNLEINVLYKDTYMNYETYTLKITNNGNTHIYLDNLENASTIYLVDENGVKHVAYIHELSKEQLHIYPYTTKQIQIKFSNGYVAGRSFSEIVLENVNLNLNIEEQTQMYIKLK